jgi:hypothetical protein
MLDIWYVCLGTTRACWTMRRMLCCQRFPIMLCMVVVRRLENWLHWWHQWYTLCTGQSVMHLCTCSQSVIHTYIVGGSHVSPCFKELPHHSQMAGICGAD